MPSYDKLGLKRTFYTKLRYAQKLQICICQNVQTIYSELQQTVYY
jgi:hypothetical protein